MLTDQFKALKNGNVSGNVYRVLAAEPVPVFESPLKGMQASRRLKPGVLVVGFSDPGEMRQINTVDQYFGYIRRSVQLLLVEGLDADSLYDPEKRVAFEATLPALDAMQADYLKKQSRTKLNQYLFMMGFVLVLLGGGYYMATGSAAPQNNVVTASSR